MYTKELEWRHGKLVLPLGFDEAGSGRSVLLLPALSSISTRAEMRPLMERLAPRFRAVTADWPGFGDLPRPKVAWSPDLLSAYLDWLLRDVTPEPFAVIAAGHAGAYALHHFARHPGAAARLVLIAPTWRGPFPSMMGGSRRWFALLRAAFDAPVVGAALYALNLSGPMAKRMGAGHVYEDLSWLTPERLAQKRAVVRARGARYASVRFVTGALDRVGDRASFLDLARRAGAPILLVYGEATPPKSRAEIEALSRLDHVRTVRLPRGKLSVHEEFAPQVADAIEDFLTG